MDLTTMLRTRSVRLGVLIVVAGAWLATLHVWYRPDPEALVPLLVARQRAYFAKGSTSAERQRLRRNNPEWDLMGRTFTVLAFANLGLRSTSERPAALATIDRVLDDTLAEDARAWDVFLLPYAHRAPFEDRGSRSLFVDGEVAMMLASRQLVEPSPRYVAPLRARVDRIIEQLNHAPLHSGESYPDEAWTFCNTVALAALRMSDALDGRDHSVLAAQWLASARAHLVDAKTGLLVSSFTYQGTTLDGPEGSTLWLAAHMLQLVDDDFAQEQYQVARRELVGEALGFAWAREWPAARQNVEDIDSGPTVPLVGANAASSGLALLGASAFGDRHLLEELTTSLSFAAFPTSDGHQLHFAAGNQLADSVLLYALVQGPLWAKVRRERT